VGSGPPEPHATPTERLPVLDLQTLLRRTLGDPDEVLPATRPALVWWTNVWALGKLMENEIYHRV
jgi:hypothetical protein